MKESESSDTYCIKMFFSWDDAFVLHGSSLSNVGKSALDSEIPAVLKMIPGQTISQLK